MFLLCIVHGQKSNLQNNWHPESLRRQTEGQRPQPAKEATTGAVVQSTSTRRQQRQFDSREEDRECWNQDLGSAWGLEIGRRRSGLALLLRQFNWAQGFFFKSSPVNRFKSKQGTGRLCGVEAFDNPIVRTLRFQGLRLWSSRVPVSLTCLTLSTPGAGEKRSCPIRRRVLPMAKERCRRSIQSQRMRMLGVFRFLCLRCSDGKARNEQA